MCQQLRNNQRHQQIVATEMNPTSLGKVFMTLAGLAMVSTPAESTLTGLKAILLNCT